MPPNKKRIDVNVNEMTPAQRRHLVLALHPHDTPFSQKFPGAWIEAWKKMAESEGMSLREWVAETLNAAAKVRT